MGNLDEVAEKLARNGDCRIEMFIGAWISGQWRPGVDAFFGAIDVETTYPILALVLFPSYSYLHSLEPLY